MWVEKRYGNQDGGKLRNGGEAKRRDESPDKIPSNMRSTSYRKGIARPD